jgi:O-antigen/teichoic acid export membrane protein
VKHRLVGLGQQTLVYGLSAAALQIVGLVTLPVYARVFSPAEYGVLEIATIGLAAMLVIADLGMASASQRSFFDYSDADAAERKRVLATGLVVAVGTATVLALLLIAFRGPIAASLLQDRSREELVVLVALALPLSILAAYTRAVMRLRFQAWRYSISAAGSAAIAGALGVVLVLSTDVGIDGVLIGLLAGNALAVLFGLAVTARDLGVRLSRRELRVMLAYGLPLLPAAAAMWGLAFLDRVMLGALASLEDVGEYAIGARFASVLMFVVSAFGLAYGPFMLSLFAEDRAVEKEVRGRTLTYVAIVLTGLSLALALFAREIATVIAPAFDDAYEVVGILCLGVTLYGLSSVTMGGISLVRRTGYFALYSGVAVVVNVALNLVLIPPLGGFGAALATAAAFGALSVLYYHRAQVLYPTPFRPRRIAIVLVAGAALMPLGFLPLGAAAVALKLLALLVFAGLVLGVVLDRPEISEVRSAARRVTRRPEPSR